MDPLDSNSKLLIFYIENSKNIGIRNCEVKMVKLSFSTVHNFIKGKACF